MRRVVAFLVFASVCSVGRPAAATEVGYSRRIGIGLALGSPAGITGKYWISGKHAVDFGLDFGPSCDRYYGCYGYKHNRTGIHADYLWHPSVLARGQVELNWHVGVGARVWFLAYGEGYNGRGGLDLAARGPIGLDLMFNNPNFLEVFLEGAPTLYIIDSGLTLEATVGVRFYF